MLLDLEVNRDSQSRCRAGVRRDRWDQRPPRQPRAELPGNSVLVLPLEAADLELGCDPAVLGANTAVIYLFRFAAVQALRLAEIE